MSYRSLMLYKAIREISSISMQQIYVALEYSMFHISCILANPVTMFVTDLQGKLLTKPE